jgi:glycerol-3-phosphate O-acyltransferase/dihydroxyacetone phosphate acyltransferase
MQRPVIGFFARLLDAVPVSRAADSAKSGLGHVFIDPNDPLKVHGAGSSFVKQCMVRGQIVLPKEVGYATGEIAEIISDTELRLSREFITTGKGGASDVKATGKVVAASQEAKEQGKKGLAYKVLPHVDQHEVYGAVFKRLNENGAIGIFPEGGSHDRPDLLPLKAGVSVMALGAMSANADLNIKLVPVGLSYFHPHKFRSRAVVEFGAPIDIPRELVGQYEKGGLNKREACGKLLEMVHDGLKAVTIRTPDFDTLMVVQAGRRLYKTPGQHWTLGQVVELNKRFIEAYLHYQDEPRIMALRDKIAAYNRRLRDLGLRDHQVERATSPRRLRNAALLLYRTGLLLAWAVLALPGVVTHAPIFIPAKIVSKIKAKGVFHHLQAIGEIEN